MHYSDRSNIQSILVHYFDWTWVYELCFILVHWSDHNHAFMKFGWAYKIFSIEGDEIIPQLDIYWHLHEGNQFAKSVVYFSVIFLK
jgi:hypothetical protein